MMMMLFFLFFFALVCSNEDWKVIEDAPKLPAGWQVDESARASGMVHLQVALKRRNVERLHQILAFVSDPSHPSYGKHLSRDEVEELVRPPRSHIEEVERWLRSHGAAVRLTGYSDVLEADLPAAAAERLLGARFESLVHAATGTRVERAITAYRAPARLAAMIDYVAGVHGLPLVGRVRPMPRDETPVGPAQLRAAYSVSALGGRSANNSMAVAEFQGQYYSPSDLDKYWSSQVDYAPRPADPKVVGTNDPSSPGQEATLDVQVILGVAPKVRTEFWSQASFDFWSDLTSFAAKIAADGNAPLVFSVSYGSQTSYPSVSFRDRLNTDFASFGARGISVIFASGDSGTGCFLCAEFVDSVPATLPSVTSVGATTFISGNKGPERAVVDFSSGGGFSSKFKRAEWQSAAISAYLSSGVDLPMSFFFDRDGRGNPDVAAIGWADIIVYEGSQSTIGGTSASAPAFAAIIALLNDERLASGKAPLGYLNPWLYQTAASDGTSFADITLGDNQDSCCFEGFNCAKGWDPVTGLGTPNATALMNHL